MGFFKKIFKPVSKVLDKVIPNEIKPLGGILRASMKDVASIYPNLKRVKDNERALQGIVNGVLRNKLNLSDEQVDAILGTL